MATTITSESVEKTVYEALPQFGVDESQITRDATFEELDVDSLDLAELSQIIEDEYGVQLKGDDVGKIKTGRDADRPRHRRHRDAGGQPQAAAREGAEGRLTAVDPAADGHLRLGGGVHAPRAARSVVRHALRLRGGRARDRHRLPDDPVRRR